ncbi:MAG: 5'/3'-nucleotidase SurE [Armatimonadetes bacterium]|nr:5'/3'-nucleotidase SurE [Armatimonadota bacterium]
MRFLLTNDDGVQAEGLLVLAKALRSMGEVQIVAPDRPRSASGHSITLHKPLRVTRVRLADGSTALASNGTPSDCVALALRSLLDERPDLVVSGINRGPNLGMDLTYSGTVSAAMEGAILGVPAFAISVASYAEDAPFEPAARFARRLASEILLHGIPPQSLLNVNVPAVPEEAIAGIQVTRVGRRHYPETVVKRTDPFGRAYYWLGGDPPEDVLEEGTDVKAIAENYIAITPVHLDLTCYPLIPELSRWGLGPR